MITDPTLEAYAVAMQTLSAANEALKRENELLRAKERAIAEMDDALNAACAENEALKRDLDLCGSAGLRAMEQVERLAAANEALRRTLQEECARINDLRRELQEARERLVTRCECVFNEAEDEVVKWCALHAETRNALATARAKLEGCERDAQRYRWLRDKCDTTTGFLLCQRREAHEWDAEIDATMESFTAIDAALAQDNKP